MGASDICVRKFWARAHSTIYWSDLKGWAETGLFRYFFYITYVICIYYTCGHWKCPMFKIVGFNYHSEKLLFLPAPGWAYDLTITLSWIQSIKRKCLNLDRPQWTVEWPNFITKRSSVAYCSNDSIYLKDIIYMQSLYICSPS